MKKILAVLLSFAIISSVIHLDEMVKIPLLLRHFSDHNANQNSISWLDFLNQHYSGNSKSDTQNTINNHSKLPFKSEKSMAAHIANFIINTSTAFRIDRFEIILKFHDTGIKSVAGFLSIWQPPKISRFL